MLFFAGDGFFPVSWYAGNGIKHCSSLGNSVSSRVTRRWYSRRYELSVRFAFSF